MKFLKDCRNASYFKIYHAGNLQVYCGTICNLIIYRQTAQLWPLANRAASAIYKLRRVTNRTHNNHNINIL